MKGSSWGQFFSYVAVGLLAIVLGVGVSLQFMGQVRSQEIPEPVDPTSVDLANVSPEAPVAPPVREEPSATGESPSAIMRGIPSSISDLPAENGESAAPPSSPPAQLGGGKANKSGAEAAGGELSAGSGALASGQLLDGFMDPFEYDPTGKKDPFRPLEADRPAEAGALEGPFQPLQRFDLDQLNLVGIIWNVRSPKAMIGDPMGNIHIVRENTRMGRNNGYVAAIREGEVVVVEPYVEEGRMTYSTRLLRINR